MFIRRAGIQWVALVVVTFFATTGRANEVSWIQGRTCASTWTIQPAQPRDTDVVQFSGPVRFYLNRCVAEKALGGKPTMVIDNSAKTIELRFVAPAGNDCKSFWDPVCGLKGSFGPLEAGQWRFLCKAGGAAFSVGFTVSGNTAVASVYYVDANAPGARNGLTWKDAFTHLQDALACTGESTEIRVAQGTYRPDIGTDIEPGDQGTMFQLGKGVVLKGGYAGYRATNPNARDVHAYRTVLSGDLAHDDKPVSQPADLLESPDRMDNSCHVVSISGTDATAALDGFTITGGIDTAAELPDELGGGGGIYNDGGNATIRNCLITANATFYRGGALYSQGDCTAALVDCTVTGNWSKWAGGAVYCHWSGNLVISHCVIVGNGAEFQGGGLYANTAGQLLISNTVLSGNRTTDLTWGRGGAFYGSAANVYLNHCTLVGNLSAAGSALACVPFSSSDTREMSLSNCILWGDPNLVYTEDAAIVTITDSDVCGGWTGDGNIDADPCFVAMGSWNDAGTVYDPCDDAWVTGDYRLQWSSPCVDAGSLQACWDPNGTDLGGRPRVSGLTVDIGAYELGNNLPVANAGPDVSGFAISAATKAAVTLDAGKSYDPEGQPLSYRWYLNDELVGEQALLNVNLATGTYTFKVVVSDPTGQTASDEAVAAVTLVTSTSTFVSPRKLKRHSSQDVFTLTVLPRGKSVKHFDASEPLRLFPGGIPAVGQSAFTWLTGETMVLGTFRRADIMAAIPTNGQVELRIVGRLKDGQYFSAADKVTIE